MGYKNDVEINKRLHEHALHAIDVYNKDWFILHLLWKG